MTFKINLTSSVTLLAVSFCLLGFYTEKVNAQADEFTAPTQLEREQNNNAINNEFSQFSEDEVGEEIGDSSSEPSFGSGGEAGSTNFGSGGGAKSPSFGSGGGAKTKDAVTTLQSPTKFKDISSFLTGALQVLIILAIPIIVFFIIYSGFLYVTAMGSEDKIKKATTSFTWTIVGGLLILGAKVIQEVLEATIKSI